jgi:hypothetical protein
MENMTSSHANLYKHQKIIVNNNESIVEIIINSVLRSMRYSSKTICKCEFTDKKYDSTEEEKFRLVILNQASQLNKHHCTGNLYVHSENLKYEKLANMIFECLYFIIKKHSLQGKVINIERSNGKIMQATVLRDSIIQYREEYINLYVYVEFEEDGECKYKLVPLGDHFSQSTGRTVKGIINLNPELFQDKLILTLSNFPKDIEDISTLYYNLITKEFDKLKINYEFKYE